HLSVRENVAYGLRVQKTSATEIGGRVDESLRMVKMQEFAASRPSKLSGGQQQRVALSRAIVNRPLLLLLDEPLSALDANLRKQMQSELKALQREIGITFLFVTHDQEEAMALSDRIALVRDGALEQVASAREIYAHPATAYTARFIGQTNLLRGEILDGMARCGAIAWPSDDPGGAAIFSLCPEPLRLASAAVTLCSLLLAYPLAYYLSFHAGAPKELLYQLVIVPLWVSYLVRGYAWKTILGSQGVLNGFFEYLHLTHEPVAFLLYSPFAVVVMLTHIYTPFVFLPIYAALEHIPRTLVEASEDLGAGAAQTFLRVILPLSIPGL